MLVDIYLDLLRRLQPLRGAAPNLNLRLMPNTPAGHLQALQQEQGVIFLPETHFDAPDRNGSQPWKLRFALELRMAENWPEHGAIAVLEAACRLLINYKPPGCQNIILDRTVLDGEYGEFWVKRIVFYVLTRLTAYEPETEMEQIASLLRRIQAIEPESGRTVFDVSIPGPVVTMPTLISISNVQDVGLTVNWGAPDLVEGQDLIGYILQLKVGGTWTHSQVIRPPDTNTFTFPLTILDPAPSRVRIAAMWTNENSGFDEAAI